MPCTKQITTQSPLPHIEGQALDDEEEIGPLHEDTIMDIGSLTYAELQKKIFQARKNHFPNDLTHPIFIKKKVIKMGTKNNPKAIFGTKFTFVGDSKSNTKYLIVQNRKMEKNLEASRKQIEQLEAEVQKVTPTQVYLEELQEAILGEVLAMGETMRNLYEELVSVHKVVSPLHDMQQK